MESKNRSEEEIQGFISRIQFRSVYTDTEAVFGKICRRINSDNEPVLRILNVWKYVAFAASVCLLLMCSFSVYLYWNLKNDQWSMVEVSALPGSKMRLELPDSSIVWLNSNAWIRYPQKFAGKSRRVEFAGEALFEVKKNEECPFIVSVDGLSVQVLGTQFNILANTNSDIVETTLLNGSVVLYKSNNLTSEPDFILRPDQQALFYRKNGQIEIFNVRASMYSSWVNGQFVFEKNTLQEIVDILERAFNTQIHIEGKELQNKRLTAQFTHLETLDEILSILQVSARYKFVKEKGEVYIK